MKTIAFYKVIACHTLMIAGFSTGLGINIAHAASDDASKPEAHSDGVSATITDAAITTKMRAILMTESKLKSSNISVTTTNGVVTLDGMASHSKAKSLAESKARSIDGVKSVDNNLKTPDGSEMVAETKEVVSDSWITTKVKSDILSNSITKGIDVNVKTTDGVVVLKGELENQDAIDHVKDIAAKVNGVKGVDISGLTVAETK